MRRLDGSVARAEEERQAGDLKRRGNHVVFIVSELLQLHIRNRESLP